MSKERQRTDFKIEEFSTIVTQKGYMVQWERAALCPCIQTGSGQPDFNCPLCFGKGKFYHSPVDIQGIMVSIGQEERFTTAGEILAGMSYFTTLPENKLGFWDRLTSKRSIIRYSEVITKGDHGNKDKTRFVPLDVKILRSLTQEYRKNTDFAFDTATPYIDWVPYGLEPNAGERYSIEYETRPSWIVIDLVNVIRDTLVKSKQPGITWAQLPVKALIRLEYFMP